MITVAKSFLKQLRENRRRSVTELAYDQHAIPNSAALDKILRYEAAIDRDSQIAPWAASNVYSDGARENRFYLR